MADIVDASWFGWALAAVIGLPVATIALTELHSYLLRRRSGLAGPVHLLRTYVLPAIVLLVLLQQIPEDVVPEDGNWVKVTATVVGFLVLMFVLSSVNAMLFLDAERGSWRQRMPTIFVDLVRVVLIAAGLAVLFSWVWDANIGGLFAALGVTSIVLGLALQNAVGSIISGLLLLFEQPFQLGDWLDTGDVRGRVVEVNWRAVHIETGNGMQIVPNASLAGASFTNLSRPTSDYVETIPSAFSEEDPPLAVIALLNRVGTGISVLAAGEVPTTVRTGPGAYATSVPLATFADADAARAQFEIRAWYAARRANLHLNGADIAQGEGAEDVAALVRRFAPALHVAPEQIAELATAMDVERYADGEIVQSTGMVPTAVRYIASGRIAMNVALLDGSTVNVMNLDEGDYLGQTTLTRSPTIYTAVARTELTVLVVPRAVLDGLVRSSPALAREYGEQIEHLRQAAAGALGVDALELDVRIGIGR